MADTPYSALVGVNFPTSTDLEADKQLKLGSLKLAEAIVASIHSYIGAQLEAEKAPPSADMIGAACYLAAHAVASAFDDARKEDVMHALLGMAAINLTETRH